MSTVALLVDDKDAAVDNVEPPVIDTPVVVDKGAG
jgi:hypothetical protein